MYSVLHLSDLHRAPDDNLSNQELLSSLRADKHRYEAEDPAITVPKAIVVSGDIIQGLDLGTTDVSAELRRQYDVAEDFLARLADEFLDGDRSQIVVVPGNHDVDWNTSRAAMTEVPAGSEPKPKDAFKEDSNYRWDWKTRKFFQIHDHFHYAKKLDAYWDFIERFYKNVSGIPKLDRNSDYGLFSLFGGRVGVAAFNSCHGNDCFAVHGAIKRTAISESHLLMGEAPHCFELWIAVWHHNIEGPPYRTDYMDVNLVRNMIGRGFRVGMYGHQHKNQLEPRDIKLPDKETMAVVGAGSLCAGAKELPTGSYRQYNILEFGDDLENVRVHVRQMEVAQLFSKAHLSSVGGKSYVELAWDQPAEIKAKLQARQQSAIAFRVKQIEAHVKSKEFSKAFALLSPNAQSMDAYERTLAIQASEGLSNWKAVILYAVPPRTISDLVAAVNAHSRIKNTAAARVLLSEYALAVEMPDSTKRDLIQMLNVKEKHG